MSLFGGALALHLLEPIAVAQQLEVLPGREQQHEHQHDADAERLPQLALPALVDLADDLVVPDVLANGVFEGAFVHRAPSLPNSNAARSLALRARGLRRHFLVGRDHRVLGQHLSRSPSRQPRCARQRAERVLHDAVLERVKRDHGQPPLGLQPSRQLAPINESSPSSSPLTQIRSA